MKTRIVPALVAAGAVSLIVYYLVTWIAVSPVDQRGSDFSVFYVGALVIRDGQASHLYDQRLESQVHRTLLPPDVTLQHLPFATPPTTAILALPFSFADPQTAYRLWSVLQMALLTLAVFIAIRAGPWPSQLPRWPKAAVALAAMAGVGSLSFVLLGQLDGFSALGLAAAYASWRGGHRTRAAFWLALLGAIAKPHLALGLAVWIAARRRREEMVGAASGLGAALVVSIAVTGFGGVAGFVSALGTDLGQTPAASTLGAAGLVASWLGSGWAATPITLALSAAALAACAVLGDRSRAPGSSIEISLGAATALSLLASPHTLPHDLVLLAPAFAWAMACAAARDAGKPWPGRVGGRLLGGWGLLNLCVLLDTGTSSAAPPGRVTPWALAAIGAYALRGAQRAGPARVRLPLALQAGSGSGDGGSVE